MNEPSLLICTVWMLTEIITGVFLSLFGLEGAGGKMAGAVISEIYMFIFAVAVKHYTRYKKNRDIPMRYVFTVLLVPFVSIYLIHNIFLIADKHKDYALFSIVASLLLLFLNYVVFEVYDWITQNLEIKEKNLLYEQQLDLCTRQAKEREEFNLKIREVRHDMKDHMAALLGMMQENEVEKAIGYIRSLLKSSIDCSAGDVSRSGNIVVDSLVNYKYVLACREGIMFYANVFLPATLPFKAGHLTIVFGNLLENALDACRQLEADQRYIKLDASYTKEILTVTVSNPYEGRRKVVRGDRFATTKEDTESHGLGLTSVEQAVEWYQGQLLAECSDSIFQVTVIMYGDSGNNCIPECL